MENNKLSEEQLVNLLNTLADLGKESSLVTDKTQPFIKTISNQILKLAEKQDITFDDISRIIKTTHKKNINENDRENILELMQNALGSIGDHFDLTMTSPARFTTENIEITTQGQRDLLELINSATKKDFAKDGTIKNKNLEQNINDLRKKNVDFDSVLLHLVQTGTGQQLQNAHRLGLNLDLQLDDGKTLLHVAAARQYTKIDNQKAAKVAQGVINFLSQEISVDAIYDFENMQITPLFEAMKTQVEDPQNTSITIIEILLKNKANPNLGYTIAGNLFNEAAGINRLDLATKIAQAGVDTTVENVDGHSAIENLRQHPSRTEKDITGFEQLDKNYRKSLEHKKLQDDGYILITGANNNIKALRPAFTDSVELDILFHNPNDMNNFAKQQLDTRNITHAIRENNTIKIPYVDATQVLTNAIFGRNKSPKRSQIEIMLIKLSDQFLDKQQTVFLQDKKFDLNAIAVKPPLGKVVETEKENLKIEFIFKDSKATKKFIENNLLKLKIPKENIITEEGRVLRLSIDDGKKVIKANNNFSRPDMPDKIEAYIEQAYKDIEHNKQYVMNIRPAKLSDNDPLDLYIIVDKSKQSLSISYNMDEVRRTMQLVLYMNKFLHQGHDTTTETLNAIDSFGSEEALGFGLTDELREKIYNIPEVKKIRSEQIAKETAKLFNMGGDLAPQGLTDDVESKDLAAQQKTK